MVIGHMSSLGRPGDNGAISVGRVLPRAPAPARDAR
jgi:hypothetical protein